MAQWAATVKTPTSTTSPERPSWHRHHPDKTTQKGFTLIELLVVLAIAGLLMALAPVVYQKSRDAAQYSSVLRTAAGEMRRARQNAVTQGLPAVFFVDLIKRTYGIAGYSSHDIPDSLQIKVTVATKQPEEIRIASIEFLPDGGATGGSIEVLRASGSGTRLRVDWLSGQVTQERLLQ